MVSEHLLDTAFLLCLLLQGVEMLEQEVAY
jgi:hypothetical protein